MKKRIFSILLIIVLMAGMLVGLTACGDDDDDEEESSSSRRSAKSSSVNVVSRKEASSPEEFVNLLVDYVNHGDVEKIIDSIDIVGMYATSMSSGESAYISVNGESGRTSNNSKYEDMMSFENAYELAKSIKDDTIANVIKEYEGNEDYYLFEMAGKEVLTNELTKMKERIYEDIVDLKAGLRMIYAENLDNVDIKLEKVGKAKKQINSDSLYQINVEISGIAKINGEKESFEDEDDIYVMEKDGKYYLTWSKWMGVNSRIDTGKMYSSRSSMIEDMIESQINRCKRDYYAEDDYEDYQFSETVTEADICGTGSYTTGMFTIKSVDENKKYMYEDDKYRGDSKKLAIEGDKIYIVDTYSEYPDNEFYYVTFKEGKNGSVEIDELKQYVNGKWVDIDD